MIVQCEACQTRFRLADEKVKPGGTKVRCSKCKVVFTVTPPEPEPVEEAVDFDSFNMEKVSEDEQDTSEFAPEPQQDSPGEDTDAEEDNGLDFSSFEKDTGDDQGEELADDFSFADTSQLEGSAAEEDFPEEPFETSFSDEPEGEQEVAEEADFGAAFEETGEADSPMEFDFSNDAEVDSTEPDESELDLPAQETEEASDFSFGEEEQPGEFSFGDDDDEGAFSFDTDEKESPAEAVDFNEPGEFSFDDESTLEDEAASEWGDVSSGDDTSFDFEEPQFDTGDAPAEAPASSPDEDGLQFGEIDFASDDSDEGESSGLESDDFSKASMEIKDEPEDFSPQRESAPPSHDYDDNEPLPVPPPRKKSSLSRVLGLLVLLLVLLGGAAGYLFIQEGSLNKNTLIQYLPFLQEYIGEAPVSSPGDRIGINISGSSYVNGQAGQMLIIQGAAVNNHPTSRSAITVKGVLLDANGKTLLQQTVFCGNQLDDAALSTKPFATIEEAMNNQFGDSLSNMNVAAGTAIPFTIVFRNLPDGIANINVEVVDSKPGAG